MGSFRASRRASISLCCDRGNTCMRAHLPPILFQLQVKVSQEPQERGRKLAQGVQVACVQQQESGLSTTANPCSQQQTIAQQREASGRKLPLLTSGQGAGRLLNSSFPMHLLDLGYMGSNTKAAHRTARLLHSYVTCRIAITQSNCCCACVLTMQDGRTESWKL